MPFTGLRNIKVIVFFQLMFAPRHWLRSWMEACAESPGSGGGATIWLDARSAKRGCNRLLCSAPQANLDLYR
jgi:hypothetical protein